MATGLSKTKWNGDDLPDTGRDVDVCLSYQGKKAEHQIITGKHPNVRRIWSNEVEDSLSGNRLYYGDNLDVLAQLYRDPNVRGKVKLVYIDPPFSTNSVFQSRSLGDAYSDLLVGTHYIEFIRERLVFLRELLAPDGSIYVHLDENMAFHIKIIMDEIFGTKNFRNWITRKKCNSKNFTRKVYGNVSDFILFYTKTENYVWNRPYEAWTEQRIDKEYPYTETGTGRRYKRVPVHAPGVRNGETGKPWRGKNPPPGKHWQFTPAKLDEFDARGEIYWSSNGNPRRKVYLDESKGVPIQDIWLDCIDPYNQNIKITGYPTEKNPELLARIIKASSNPGDLILDCFSGSGTTLCVANEYDRSWIGVDCSPEAIATTIRSFAVGTEPMGDYVNKPEVTSGEKLLKLFDDKKLTSQGCTKVHSRVEFKYSLFVPEFYNGELDDVIKKWCINAKI
jgi:adenine-specific DNA-methyltransferase